MAFPLAPIPLAVASLVCSGNPRRDCNGKRENGLLINPKPVAPD